jgi:hypothetical protein
MTTTQKLKPVVQHQSLLQYRTMDVDAILYSTVWYMPLVEIDVISCDAARAAGIRLIFKKLGGKQDKLPAFSSTLYSCTVLFVRTAHRRVVGRWEMRQTIQHHITCCYCTNITWADPKCDRRKPICRAYCWLRRPQYKGFAGRNIRER